VTGTIADAAKAPSRFDITGRATGARQIRAPNVAAGTRKMTGGGQLVLNFAA
jgi:hypothetical protein